MLDPGNVGGRGKATILYASIENYKSYHAVFLYKFKVENRHSIRAKG